MSVDPQLDRPGGTWPSGMESVGVWVPGLAGLRDAGLGTGFFQACAGLEGTAQQNGAHEVPCRPEGLAWRRL
jgi:hypothetical protein